MQIFALVKLDEEVNLVISQHQFCILTLLLIRAPLVLTRAIWDVGARTQAPEGRLPPPPTCDMEDPQSVFVG